MSKFAPVKVLSIIDDIITHNLVDHVLIDTKCSKVYEPTHNLYSLVFNQELLLSIIRRTSHFKHTKDYRSAAMGLVCLYRKELIALDIAEDVIDSYFVEHLCRYLAIFSQHSGIELVNTYRYKGIPEVTVISSRPYKKGEILAMVEGTWGVMNAAENEEFKTNECDFSVMYSSVKKTYNVFLGPPRFINHDCLNNVEYYREGTKVLLRATRAIRKGEEIFTSYGEEYFKHSVTKEDGTIEIRNDCKCDSCVSGKTALKEESNIRLAKSKSQSRTSGMYVAGDDNYGSITDHDQNQFGTTEIDLEPGEHNYYRPQQLVHTTNELSIRNDTPLVEQYTTLVLNAAELESLNKFKKRETPKKKKKSTAKDDEEPVAEIVINDVLRKTEALPTGLETENISFWLFDKPGTCSNCKSSSFNTKYDYNFDATSNSCISLLLRCELIHTAHLCSRCFKHFEIFVNPWPCKKSGVEGKDDDADIKKYGVILGGNMNRSDMKENEDPYQVVDQLYLYLDRNQHRVAYKLKDNKYLLFKDFTTTTKDLDFKPFLQHLPKVATTPFFIDGKEWDVMTDLMLCKASFDASSAAKAYLCGSMHQHLQFWYSLKSYTGLDKIKPNYGDTVATEHFNYKKHFLHDNLVKSDKLGWNYKLANKSLIGEMVWLDCGASTEDYMFWPGIITELSSESNGTFNIVHFDQQTTLNVNLKDVYQFNTHDDLFNKMKTLRDFSQSWVKNAIKFYETGELHYFNKSFRNGKLNNKYHGYKQVHHSFIEKLLKGDVFLKEQRVKVFSWSNQPYMATVLGNMEDGRVKVKLEDDGVEGLVETIRIQMAFK